MILKLVDRPPEEGFTLTREVWLRNEKHLVLPDWFPQETTFVLSELKTNRLYLSEHRDQIVPSIRQNMGLRREPLEWVERVTRIVVGLVLMAAAFCAAAFCATILNKMKAHPIVYLCGAESLMVVAVILYFGFRAMRGTLQPSYTKQVAENVEDLIAKGRLMICEARVAFFSMSQPSLCYTLFPEHGRAISMEVAFPEYQYIKFPGNERRFNILVLYVNSELHVVL